MPEKRLARARTTLPKGYQFGDGRHFFEIEELKQRQIDQWLEPMFTANVIEGEHFASDALLVEKCTEHGRERVSDCAECQSLPRLETRGDH